METEILFEEIQPFINVKAILILRSTSIILLAGTVFFLLSNFGSKFETASGFLIGSIASGVMSLFLNKARLITQVRTDGIYVCPPMQNSFTVCYWENISKLFIREYDPLQEYGGWGRRGFKDNMAFNVSGNIGIQLIFTNDSRLLIGTEQAEEIAKILSSLGKLNYAD